MRILQGVEPDHRRRLHEIAASRTLVELKCPRCSCLHISTYHAGALNTLCPACKKELVEAEPVSACGEEGRPSAGIDLDVAAMLPEGT